MCALYIGNNWKKCHFNFTSFRDPGWLLLLFLRLAASVFQTQQPIYSSYKCNRQNTNGIQTVDKTEKQASLFPW